MASKSASSAREFHEICVKASQLSTESDLCEIQDSFNQKLGELESAAKNRYVLSVKDDLFSKMTAAIDKAINEENVLSKSGAWMAFSESLCVLANALVQEFASALKSLKCLNSDSESNFTQGLCDHSVKAIKATLTTKKLRELARERYYLSNH